MSSGGSLSRALTDLDYYEFGGFERCKAHKYVDNPRIDVGLGSSLAVALDKERGRWSGALKCGLAEQGRHERADVEPKLRPKRLVHDDPVPPGRISGLHS